MVLYTLLGVMGTGVSLVSSLISKDLVDIITGHETGRLISTFAAIDWIFNWKYFGSTGIRLCVYTH